MADRPKVQCETSLQDTGAGSVGFYRIYQFSTNDTVTLSDFTTVTSAQVIRGDTLATVTSTVATNVVTLTQASMTNVKCYMMAWGTR